MLWETGRIKIALIAMKIPSHQVKGWDGIVMKSRTFGSYEDAAVCF